MNTLDDLTHEYLSSLSPESSSLPEEPTGYATPQLNKPAVVNTPSGYTDAEINAMIADRNKDIAPESDYMDEIQASLYRGAQLIGRGGADALSWGADKLGIPQASKFLDSIDWKSDDEINDAVGYDPSAAELAYQKQKDAYKAFTKNVDLSSGWDLVTSTANTLPHMLADNADIIATLAPNPLGPEAYIAGKFASGAEKAAQAAEAAKLANSSKALDRIKAVGQAPKTQVGVTSKLVQPEAQTLSKFAKSPLSHDEIAMARQAILKDAQQFKKAKNAEIESNLKLADRLRTVNNYVPINKRSILYGSGMAAENNRKFAENNDGEGRDLLTNIADAVAETALLGATLRAGKDAVGLGSGAKEAVKNIFTDTAKSVEHAMANGAKDEIKSSVANSAAQVAKLFGEGAAVNYTQEWLQILGQQLNSKDKGDLMSVISDKKNQDKANIAAISGAALAGAPKVAYHAAKVPLNIGTSAISAGVKKVKDRVAEKAKAASLAVLPAEERERLHAQHVARKKAQESEIKLHEKALEDIAKAETFEDLQNIKDAAVQEKVNDIIDDHFGSKTLHKQINEAKTVDDLKGISDVIDTKVNQKLKENSEYSLDKLKQDLIYENRQDHLTKNQKGNADSIRNATTVDELNNIAGLNKQQKGAVFAQEKNIFRPDAEIDIGEGQTVQGKIIDTSPDGTKHQVKYIDPQTKEAKTKTVTNDKVTPLSADKVDLTHHNERLNKLKNYLLKVEKESNPSITDKLNSNVESIKNYAIAQHKGAIATKKLWIEKQRASDYLGAAFDSSKRGFKAMSEKISPETREAIANTLGTAKQLTNDTINTMVDLAKEPEKSAVRGMFTDLLNGRMNERLYDLSDKQLDELSPKLAGNKKAQDIVYMIKKNRNKAKKEFGLDTEEASKGGFLGKLDAMTNSPIAYKLYGLMSAGVDKIKDTATLNKVKDTFDSITEEDVKNMDKEEKQVYDTVAKDIEIAKQNLQNKKDEVINAKEKDLNTKAEDSKKVVTDYFTEHLPENSEIAKVLTNPEEHKDYKQAVEKDVKQLVENNDLNSLKELYRVAHAVNSRNMLNGSIADLSKEIENAIVPIDEDAELSDYAIIKHSKDGITDETYNQVADLINTASEDATHELSNEMLSKFAKQAQELHDESEKYSALKAKLDTIQITEPKELEKAMKDIEKIAKELNIDICKI